MKLSNEDKEAFMKTSAYYKVKKDVITVTSSLK